MKSYGSAITRIAIVWAAVMLASAVVLKGTPSGGQMIPILAGGAVACILIVRALQKQRNS